MRLSGVFHLMIKKIFINLAIMVILSIQKNVVKETAWTCLIVGQNYLIAFKTNLFR